MKVINQQKNSIIEDLLYSEKVKRTFSAVTQEDSKHPYAGRSACALKSPHTRESLSDKSANPPEKH